MKTFTCSDAERRLKHFREFVELLREVPFTCSDAERRLKQKKKEESILFLFLSHAVMPKGNGDMTQDQQR